jgi:hypothetical protein
VTAARALTEIEAAALTGFRRWRDFSRARRQGLFPAPDLELPDGPRWSETRLEAWVRGDLSRPTVSDEERMLLRRLGG